MRLELRSPLRKLCFAGVCFAGMALYMGLALPDYLASSLAAIPDSQRLQKAIRLEPSNAEYRELLARNFALSGSSLDEAVSNYRAAVSLNPYVARYWLDLASIYQVAGSTREQQQSVEKAVETDPSTPYVAWEAANFFLIQGDRERALRYFRPVLANDDLYAVDSALVLCWRASGDANQILDLAMPRRAALYLRFLNMLINRQQVAAAENVWIRLIELKQNFSVPLAFPYFRFLLVNHEVTAAQTAWQQLSEVDHSLERYLPSRENLIINGGFEENLLNGGFDWWYQQQSHVALGLDTSDFHSGTRSLSITFDGNSVGEAGLSQLIPIKPDTPYEFSAESKTEDIDSASGPRFAITDAYTNSSFVLTDDLLGSNPWHQQQVRFRTGPETNLILLKIVRQPANALIRGKIWIDDLKLVENETEDRQR